MPSALADDDVFATPRTGAVPEPPRPVREQAGKPSRRAGEQPTDEKDGRAMRISGTSVLV